MTNVTLNKQYDIQYAADKASAVKPCKCCGITADPVRKLQFKVRPFWTLKMSAKGLVNQFISLWSLFLLNSALSKKSRLGKVKKLSNNNLESVYLAFLCPKSLKRTKPNMKSFKGPYPNHVDKWGGMGLLEKLHYNTQIDLLSISVLIGGRGAEKAPYSDHVDCVMCMWYYNEIFVEVT